MRNPAYNSHQVAAAFGKCLRWVQDRIRDGTFPAYKLGGTYMMRKSDLEAAAGGSLRFPSLDALKKKKAERARFLAGTTDS